MFERNTASNRRIQPRRHDVGAALMLKFRDRDAASRSGRSLRLRTIDALHALMVTMICLTAAIVLNEDAGEQWSKLVHLAFAPADASSTPPLPMIAARIAPAQPDETFPVPAAMPTVRLTRIEEESDTRIMTLPASMTTSPSRHASAPVEPSPTSQAARQPFRAALDLGDKAARTSRN